jgi:glycerol kinase
MTSYILAIDQGTTSSRAIVFNNLQQIVGMAKQEFMRHPTWSRPVFWAAFVLYGV